MPFGLRPWHIIAIVVVALLIFGPSRLPGIGKSLGKFFKDLKQGTQEMSSSFKEGLAETESTAKSAAQPMPPPSTQSVDTADATGSDGEKAAEKLFCTACGTPNPPTAKFCRSCGTKIQG
jgi:sec-independent protein translocase protein TatA